VSVETYYTVLGISETASQAEIKAAYRELVRQVHPDSVPNASPYWKQAAEEKTKEINEAYRILSNASKRREYDRLLAEARQGMHSQPSQSPPTPPPQQPTPQPPASAPYWSRKYNWNAFRHLAAKYPVRLGFLGIVACGIVVSLLPDSNAPTSSQSRVVAPVASNTPARTPTAIATAPMPTGVAAARTPTGVAATPTLSLSDVVREASERYRLDPDLLNSVIRVGSGFNPHAVSPKGAQGLMQLMPQTASKLGVPNAFDPAANVDAGTRYLRELLERYNFDLIKALAAYYAGPEIVDLYGGVPPDRETRAYVASIVRDFNRKKIAQQKAAKADAEERAKANKKSDTSGTVDKPSAELLNLERLPNQAPQLPTETRPSPSPQSDLSQLSSEERQSIESVCSHAKFYQGPAAYNRCLVQQLDALASGPSRPDLSRLTSEEQQSIESVCSHAKFHQGPAEYNRCLVQQLNALASGPSRPDLSRLTSEEQQSIESVCSKAKFHQGPAEYNRCLVQQLNASASGPIRPDLSRLTSEEQQSIESVCSHAKFHQGPAEYNRCLVQQLDALGRSR
jgi:hypothetical protein